MTVDPAGRNSAHLDTVRGLAALVVFVGHTRYLFFPSPLGSRPPAGWLGLPEAVATMGHQAVIVFFVLSGFFITSTAARQFGHWSWASYLIDRLSRLYVVLLPALVATGALDALGLAFGPNQSLYRHTSDNPVIYFDVPARTDWTYFVGSALFLQNIKRAPYGSNSPLWSLSYEAWYYVLFPALVLVLTSRTARGKVAHVLVAAAVCWLVGPKILLLFPVWLAGAAVRGLKPLPLSWGLIRALTWMAGGLLAGALYAARCEYVPELAGDYLVGAACAVWAYLLLHDRRPASGWGRWGRSYGVTATWLAGFSYTLYLVHLPFLMAVYSFAVHDGAYWSPGPAAAMSLAAVLAAGLLYAWGFSLLTERQTDKLRKWARRVLRVGRPSPGRPPHRQTLPDPGINPGATIGCPVAPGQPAE